MVCGRIKDGEKISFNFICLCICVFVCLRVIFQMTWFFELLHVLISLLKNSPIFFFRWFVLLWLWIHIFVLYFCETTVVLLEEQKRGTVFRLPCLGLCFRLIVIFYKIS